MSRDVLPQRRYSEVFDFTFAQIGFVATIGFYADGRLGEIFLNAKKRDELFDHLARDTAILISFALQQGVSLDVLRKALTRGENDQAQGLAGHVLDLLINEMGVVA